MQNGTCPECEATVGLLSGRLNPHDGPAGGRCTGGYKKPVELADQPKPGTPASRSVARSMFKGSGR